jgi:hypothetical protein
MPSNGPKSGMSAFSKTAHRFFGSDHSSEITNVILCYAAFLVILLSVSGARPDKLNPQFFDSYDSSCVISTVVGT